MKDLEKRGLLRFPVVPDVCEHNGHMFYALLPEWVDRNGLLRDLATNGINAIFHYVPLHASPYGRDHGRTCGELTITENISKRLIRLPLWLGLTEDQQFKVVEALVRPLEKCKKSYHRAAQ